MGERWVKRSGEDYKGQIRTGDGGRRCGLKKECGGAEGKTKAGVPKGIGELRRKLVEMGQGENRSGWGARISLEGEPEDPRNQYWEDKKRRLRKELGWEAEGLGTPERRKK